jgi:hypothetical protein
MRCAVTVLQALTISKHKRFDYAGRGAYPLSRWQSHLLGESMMRIRTWAVAGVAVIVALAGAALLVVERKPVEHDVPIHGDFHRRFQPTFEGLGTDAISSRIAGVGRSQELAPVEPQKR